MLQEFLQLLQRTAVDAHGPHALPVEDKRAKHFVINGERVTVPVPAPPRSHIVQSLDSFVQSAKRYGTAHAATENHSTSLWHNHKSLIAVLDDVDDRYDTVTLPLVYSETYAWLMEVGKKQFDQRNFVSALKTILIGCVSESLLPAIRKVEVASASKMQSEIAHGRERGTKEFAAEMANAANIPEIVSVACRVYDAVDIAFSVNVRCSLDIKLPEMEIRFVPLPNELTKAVADTQEYIHNRLVTEWEDHESVFYGTP